MKKNLIISLFFCILSTSFSLEVPPISSEFNDVYGLLYSDEEKEIIRILETANNDSKDMQIALLIIRSLEGESIENYAIEASKNWELDKKGIEKGVLLIIAGKENEAYIYVGDNLKSKLTDTICSRIVNKMIIPYLNKDKHYKGIKTGLSAIIAYEIGDEKKIKNLEAKIKKEVQAWKIDTGKWKIYSRKWIYIILGAIPILGSIIGGTKGKNFAWLITLLHNLLGYGSYSMGGINTDSFFSDNNLSENTNVPPNDTKYDTNNSNNANVTNGNNHSTENEEQSSDIEESGS